MGVYVIQVVGGRERSAISLVTKHAADLIDDCFVPSYELKKRFDGAWRTVTELLFPGYLFVVTSHPAEVAQVLRTVPVFMRLLGRSGDAFVPLSPDEIVWLKTFTTANTHMVEMSQGIIEGDAVVVTDGPLKGREALISKINRHKRLAYLDMHMFGREKTVRVGLEIVHKK